MNTDRRRFVQAAGTLGVASLAGCSSPTSDGTREAPPRTVAWPNVDSPKLAGWTEMDRRKSSRTDTRYIFTVHSYQRTIVYENTALRRSIRRKTNGQFDSPLAIFFATHVALRGTGTFGASEEEILKSAVPEFKSEMRDSGIEKITPVRERQPLPNVPGSITREFSGHYPTPGIRTEIPLGDGLGTRTLKIESSKLPISGLLTVWKVDSGTAFVAGGAYPAADFEKESTISVTSEKGDGIDATVSVDLNLRPQEIRRTINALTESVEKSDASA